MRINCANTFRLQFRNNVGGSLVSVPAGADEDQRSQPDQARAADGAGRATGGSSGTSERVPVH